VQVTGQQTTAPSDKDYWDVFVGEKNTQFYVSRFERFASGGSRASWNWPAFFVSFLWLLYRKMWGYAAIYFVAPALIQVAFYFVFLALFEHDVAGGMSFLVFLLATLLLFPMYANWLYYRVASKRIAEVTGRQPDPAKCASTIARLGGTGILPIVILCCVLIPFNVGILAAIAIPAYQDYTIRAQVSEGLSLAYSTKSLIGESLIVEERVPADRLALGLDPDPQASSGEYVQSVNVVNGRIDIVYGNQANENIAGRTLTLTPFVMGSDAPESVTWVCGNGELPDGEVFWYADPAPTTVDSKYLPVSCREGY